MIQGQILLSSSGLIHSLVFSQRLFSGLWLPKQTSFWIELDAEFSCREKRILCFWLHTELFVSRTFSHDSYFITQDWSPELNVHTVYIICIKPDGSYAVYLSSFSATHPPQLPNNAFFLHTFVLTRKQKNLLRFCWAICDSKAEAQYFVLQIFSQGKRSSSVKYTEIISVLFHSNLWRIFSKWHK